MHVVYHELLADSNLNLTYKNSVINECGIEILISACFSGIAVFKKICIDE
jgi:hypothetical protein